MLLYVKVCMLDILTILIFNHRDNYTHSLSKQEYDKAQLQKLDEYLNDQIDKLRRHMKSLREVPGAWQAEFAQVSKVCFN